MSHMAFKEGMACECQAMTTWVSGDLGARIWRFDVYDNDTDELALMAEMVCAKADYTTTLANGRAATAVDVNNRTVLMRWFMEALLAFQVLES